MNLFSKLALAGIGTVALAGSALAAERAMHVMNVDLPDGSVAHVRYFGDVAPRIELVPVADVMPFAGFDQMFADFDRQQAEMMRHVAAMQQQAAMPANAKPDQTAAKAASGNGYANGMVSYSYTSYSTGADGKGCTQSYQMTSYGSAQPKVVSQNSGDCGKTAEFGDAPTPVRAPAQTPAAHPRTVPHDAV